MKRATYTILNISNDKTISIHALVKRATNVNKGSHILENISIHALVKRATASDIIRAKIHVISIHALVKRATVAKKTFQNPNYISIHALVKRATDVHLPFGAVHLHFNPRPREEGDEKTPSKIASATAFQSTPS